MKVGIIGHEVVRTTLLMTNWVTYSMPKRSTCHPEGQEVQLDQGVASVPNCRDFLRPQTKELDSVRSELEVLYPEESAYDEYESMTWHGVIV